MNVVPVKDARRIEAFIRLPWQIYSGDKDWVPPLVRSERTMLDPARNPFWKRAEAAHFILEKQDRVAGRISAIVNRAHNEVHRDTTGFWGFFECVNDADAARALFDRAGEWLRERGMTRMLGPVNPSLNDSGGILIEGFGLPPFVMMPYCRPYYRSLVEDAGFAKAMDLYAYLILHNEINRERIDRISRMVKERGEVTIRPVNLSRFEEELAIVKDIYNDAWEKNWGFVPLSDDEIRFAAREMKAVLLPELAYIAEMKGRPVAFSIALPDVNRALKKCDGSLWPFGWWHFLRFNLRRIPTFRLIALGVRKEVQNLGLGTLFYQKYMDEGLKRNYYAAELSWILEVNHPMNRAIRLTGAKLYKTYRLYERPLETPAQGPQT
jgi:GNAT superfamily N-acetyltransferase